MQNAVSASSNANTVWGASGREENTIRTAVASARTRSANTNGVVLPVISTSFSTTTSPMKPRPTTTSARRTLPIRLRCVPVTPDCPSRIGTATSLEKGRQTIRPRSKSQLRDSVTTNEPMTNTNRPAISKNCQSTVWLVVPSMLEKAVS